jgi:3-hydroxypropanoate dehydrogenase
LTSTISDADLDIVFRGARTYRAWKAGDVSPPLIQAIYELVALGPTNANCEPGRFLFIKSRVAKERLKPHLEAGNVEKTMNAPATVIIGYDLAFAENLPRLSPHQPKLKDLYKEPEFIEETAFRSGTLQGGYLILAARALGLDCGPMSGFDNAGVDREFFAGTRIKSNFLCNLGHGDPASLFPRLPRLTFEETCEIL